MIIFSLTVRSSLLLTFDRIVRTLAVEEDDPSKVMGGLEGVAVIEVVGGEGNGAVVEGGSGGVVVEGGTLAGGNDTRGADIPLKCPPVNVEVVMLVEVPRDANRGCNNVHF